MSVLQIEQLRRQLREKFPEAHRPTPIEPQEIKPAPLEFPAGQVCEIVASHPSTGASLVLYELLAKKRDLPLALIDGRNTFDPASYGNRRCRRLIWLRCAKTEQALKCADLFLRDGNLPLVLLDLHLTSERELRQIPSSLWHRLKIQARDSGTALATLTPRALLPTPHKRLTLSNRFSLDHLEQVPPVLQTSQPTDQSLAEKA